MVIHRDYKKGVAWLGNPKGKERFAFLALPPRPEATGFPAQKLMVRLAADDKPLLFLTRWRFPVGCWTGRGEMFRGADSVRLTPKVLVYGVSPVILRACALSLREFYYFSINDFSRALGAPIEEARPVLDQLLNDGFLTPAKHTADPEILARIEHANDNIDNLYLPTSKFRQLAVANISHGIHRADADKLLLDVIEAARQINVHPERYAGYGIAKLVVFGSYLGEVELLGDIDIGYGIQSDLALRKKFIDEQLPRFSLNDLHKCHLQVLQALRCGRTKFVSLHPLAEVISLRTPFKVVFDIFKSSE